jgi:hypothetical protein
MNMLSTHLRGESVPSAHRRALAHPHTHAYTKSCQAALRKSLLVFSVVEKEAIIEEEIGVRPTQMWSQ